MKRNSGWHGFKTVDAYVKNKLKKLSAAEKDFDTLFDFLFSEKDGVMYEKSVGYRIEKTTYGQSKISVEKKAAALSALLSDVPSGSVVGICMQNSLDWIETFWAVLMCSFRPLLVNLRLPNSVLERCFADVGVAAVISDDKNFSVKTLSARLPNEPAGNVVFVKHFGSEVLFMSSGTTQNVKVCAYSAEELCAQIYDSSEIISRCKQLKQTYHGSAKLLALLPFYHIFGFCAMYWWFAFFSCTFVQLNGLSADVLTSTVKRHEVTHIFAVPLFWQKIYEQATRKIKAKGEKTYGKFQKGLKISASLGNSSAGKAFCKKAFHEVRENLFGDSVQFMISGGSMLSKEVSKFFNGIGYTLANGYGMTETGITGVELSGKRKEITEVSIGKPFPSIEYKIENGRLFVKGSSLCKYIVTGGKKFIRNKDEWFDTDDLAQCKKGKYYICGRNDDLIVAPSGENLNPNLTEPLFKAAGVQNVCLISCNREPVLLAELSPYISKQGAARAVEEIKNIAREHGLTEQIGKIVAVCDVLLKDDEFKLNRKRLSEEYARGKLTLFDFSSEKTARSEYSPLEKKVLDLVASSLGKSADEIDLAADYFADLGGTSLDYFSLAADINTEFGFDILSQKDKKLTSAKEISEYLKGLIG